MDGYPKLAINTMFHSRKMLTWRKRTCGFKKNWKSHDLNWRCRNKGDPIGDDHQIHQSIPLIGGWYSHYIAIWYTHYIAIIYNYIFIYNIIYIYYINYVTIICHLQGILDGGITKTSVAQVTWQLATRPRRGSKACWQADIQTNRCYPHPYIIYIYIYSIYNGVCICTVYV